MYIGPKFVDGIDADILKKTTQRYVEALTDDDINFRRGAAGALSVLPSNLLFPIKAKVLVALCKAATNRKSGSEKKRSPLDPSNDDAEARAAATESLAAVCCTLGLDLQKGLCREEVIDVALPALLDALCDYSVDKRGDVGSWVREAAMEAIGAIGILLCNARELSQDVSLAILNGLLKQSVEKINRIRETAGKVLAKLLHHLQGFPSLPSLTLLQEIIPKESFNFWTSPAECFPKMVELKK